MREEPELSKDLFFAFFHAAMCLEHMGRVLGVAPHGATLQLHVNTIIHQFLYDHVQNQFHSIVRLSVLRKGEEEGLWIYSQGVTSRSDDMITLLPKAFEGWPIQL